MNNLYGQIIILYNINNLNNANQNVKNNNFNANFNMNNVNNNNFNKNFNMNNVNSKKKTNKTYRYKNSNYVENNYNTFFMIVLMCVIFYLLLKV